MGPEMSQNHQSHLCCHFNNTSPRPTSTSTSAIASGYSMPRLREAVPVVTLLVSTKMTIDFHSHVKSPLKTCSQMHSWLSVTSHSPLKMCSQMHRKLSLISHLTADFSHSGGSPLWHGSLIVVQSSCSCEFHTAYWFHTSCCAGCPLWAWFCWWCSIRSDTVHSRPGLGRTLRFPIFLWRRLLLNWASPCYQVPPIKINRVLFPLTMLRSLSFLIPSFTKINMSSDPVVYLPLTYAWGLLGVCHRDGSFAVLSPLWLERLETLLEVVPSLLQKLKWLHHLSGLWTPLQCCKQIDNSHRTSVAWPHFSMRAEEIPLSWQTDNCCRICVTL